MDGAFMGDIVLPDPAPYYYAGIFFLSIALALAVRLIRTWKAHDMNKAAWILSFLLVLSIIPTVAFFHEGYEIDRDNEKQRDTFYGHQSYRYQLTITPNNVSEYTILLPVPDTKVLDDYGLDGNATATLDETEYGIALRIEGNGTVDLFSEVMEADSEDLTLEIPSPPRYHHWIFSNATGNGSVSITFHYEYRGSDYIGLFRLATTLTDGWDQYDLND